MKMRMLTCPPRSHTLMVTAPLVTLRMLKPTYQPQTQHSIPGVKADKSTLMQLLEASGIHSIQSGTPFFA